jgi:hypothetical protein
MLKKIALPVVALLVMLILSSAPAQAAVRFGIGIGAPVYTYPAYPVYPAPYPYVAPNYYYAPAPAYIAPSFGFVWGGGHGHSSFDHHSYVHSGHRR